MKSLNLWFQAGKNLKCSHEEEETDGMRSGIKSMANKVTDIQIIDSSGRDGEPKMWVKVLFDNGCEWYPKITEIGKICSGIGLAEDKKYPNGEGYRYLQDFINLCYGKTRKQIDSLYLDRFDPNKVTSESKKKNDYYKE